VKRRVQTSKVLLIVWLVLAVPLLFRFGLDQPRLILWLAGLACLVWNRIDSRKRAYRFEVKGPQGTSLVLSSDEVPRK
jgi:hypothetical protein